MILTFDILLIILDILTQYLGFLMSAILLVLYMAIKRNGDEIALFFTLMPFCLAFFITNVSVGFCGLLGSLFSIGSTMSPLEKIVRNFLK